MFDSILFSLNVVLPIFIMIFLGWLAVRIKLIDRLTMRKIGNITFNYFLSCRIFLDIALSGTRLDQKSPMTLYAFVLILCNVAVITFFSYLFVKPRESVTAFIQICFRNSFAVLGLSIIRNMFGEAGVAASAILLVMSAIVTNSLAVITLTRFDGHNNLKTTVRRIIRNIVTNPMIIAAFLGLLASHLKLSLPPLMLKPLSYLGDMAIPLSLLCIGAALDFNTVREKWKLASVGAFIKTFVIALYAIPLAVWLGFRGIELGAIAILFTTANPAATYVMIAAMDGDADLAATGIVLSTILTIFSTTIAVFLLRYLSYI